MIDPDSHIGFLIHDIARLSRRDFNRRASSQGLSQAQWRALTMLSRHEGVNQVTLAECLEIQPMTLVRQLDRLEASGLIARRSDPDDRRAVRLYLTADAQPLLERMYEIGEQLWEMASASLRPEEHARLVDALRRIKKNLLAAAPCGERPVTENDDKHD